MIKQHHLDTFATNESPGFGIGFLPHLFPEDFDLFNESMDIAEERIWEKAELAQVFSQLLRFAKPISTTWDSTSNPTVLATENILLRKEIDVIKQKLDELISRMPEEKVIVLREISREEAKQEIQELFIGDRTLYYSDIAEELQLDLRLVVDICHELEAVGEIEVDADV